MIVYMLKLYSMWEIVSKPMFEEISMDEQFHKHLVSMLSITAYITMPSTLHPRSIDLLYVNPPIMAETLNAHTNLIFLKKRLPPIICKIYALVYLKAVSSSTSSSSPWDYILYYVRFNLNLFILLVDWTTPSNISHTFDQSSRT